MSIIPLRAPECAASAGMDLDLLVACANMEGERLVAGAYNMLSPLTRSSLPTWVRAPRGGSAPTSGRKPRVIVAGFMRKRQADQHLRLRYVQYSLTPNRGLRVRQTPPPRNPLVRAKRCVAGASPRANMEESV